MKKYRLELRFALHLVLLTIVALLGANLIS